MKNLGNLSPATGSHRSRKRLGRGIGSGLGKTAGKGHKGQKARKGCKITAGFEGGQTPLYRRVPKFGFSRDSLKIPFNLISLSDLNQFADGDKVGRDQLAAQGLLREGLKQPIKLLANGSLERRLTVQLDKITKGAKQAIESLGGEAVSSLPLKSK
ncbi:MAG: 50S ribosomal protein L15 [Oligoflexales bacterium]|nr:50S ribosomal protein L15 [Oligoflexales bacterium]